jgi:penicillin-binding protein 1A
VTLMQGVIKFGTAHLLNGYNIPVQKAGKTGTTNNNTDGWFIGYTPELLAATWVGCDDPFIRIYQNTAGGADMSAPKWGIFMSKVYADKKLDYGKIKEFEKPSEFNNDPIYADQNLDKYFRDGDSTTLDEGNGDAGDFINTPMPENQVVEKVGIESQIPTKNADTSGKAKKPDDKKDNKLPTPGIKPAEDKAKKTVKPKPTNDY